MCTVNNTIPKKTRQILKRDNMLLELNDYCKLISGSEVLSNITLKLESGKVYGLQGKNGSGKTMLMRAVSGLINPTSGYVSIDGKILGKDIDFPQSLGLLIENPGFIESYTGFKNLKLLASINSKTSDETICGLMERLNLDPQDKKKYKKYSLGMKQKIGVIATVMEDPELIILDEPFNALDEKSSEIVAEIIEEQKNQGKLVIVSCHDKEELEKIADVIFVIENGKIIRTVNKDENKE